MPRKDGTGPMGQGAATGRGMGMCQGNQQKSHASYARCNRNSKGPGCGQGMGFRYAQNFNSNTQALENDELAFLKQKASNMENILNNIRQKISELE